MKKLIAILAVAMLLYGCTVPQAPAAPPPAPTAQENPRPQTPPSRETPEPAQDTLTLEVPAGYTLVRIGMALEELGVSTTAEFVEAAQTLDVSEFPLLVELPESPGRFFALEGYLFPGVYEIYQSESPESILRRMLAATEAGIDEELRRKIAQSDRTVDEVLILASIIQRESLGNDEAKPLVSAVIHNRLRTGMMLQMCKTSFYVRDTIAPLVDGDVQPFSDAYNTYICPALPAGAISNPGLSAIRAALFPAGTDYFFYIWDDDDNFHFAAQWNQHVTNVERYLR